MDKPRATNKSFWDRVGDLAKWGSILSALIIFIVTAVDWIAMRTLYMRLGIGHFAFTRFSRTPVHVEVISYFILPFTLCLIFSLLIYVPYHILHKVKNPFVGPTLLLICAFLNLFLQNTYHNLSSEYQVIWPYLIIVPISLTLCLLIRQCTKLPIQRSIFYTSLAILSTAILSYQFFFVFPTSIGEEQARQIFSKTSSFPLVVFFSADTEYNVLFGVNKQQRDTDNRWMYTISPMSNSYLQYIGNDGGFLYLLDVYSATGIIHMIPEDSVAEMHFAVLQESK